MEKDEVEREEFLQWYSPSMNRDVYGIRPVAEHGVLLDKNTENIVMYTPRSRKRLHAWTVDISRLSPYSRKSYNYHLVNPDRLHLMK